MSKKRKTLDEALVTEDERPYEIPENWVWSKSTEIFDVQYGKGLPTSRLVNEGYSVYGANGKIGFYSIYTQEESRVLMTCRGATCGTINVSEPFSFITNNSMILSPKWKVDTGFIQYLFMSQDKNALISGTAQPQITVKAFEEFYLPLPPLNEQKRIANKIEILFAKIDVAQQLIQETKETFKLRRSAILDMAFRGGNIRGEEDLPKGWQYKKFKDIATVKSNLVNPLEFLTFPHIAPDNIEKDTGRLLSYKTIQEDGVKSNKHYFEKGSILYSKIRPYLSKVVIVNFEGLCSADMYPIETELNVEYLYWYMLSPKFLEQATTAGSRSVLPKINQKELGEILVPVCSLEEQEKTVNNLNSLLQEESSTLNFIKESEKDLEKLKQSILSKAFKGELGTNNPTDEPAIELLKSILQEKL